MLQLWNHRAHCKTMPKSEGDSLTGQGNGTRTRPQTVRSSMTEVERNPISEQRKHQTTPRGFTKHSAMIAALLSEKLKKYGFGNLKINMHHTCAKNNPYSVLICHTCRLSKNPSNSSFVPMNPNNTIPAKPKTMSEKTKTKKKPQKEKMKDESPQEMRHHQQRRFTGAKAPWDTEYWVAQRLHEEPTEWVISILSNWTHLTRTQEATEETITLLNDLSDKDIFQALWELKQPRRYIRRMSSRQLDVKVKVQMLDHVRMFLLKALLDSGSTGSCISRKFVNKNEIWTRKTVIPVLVHNADGTLNQNGSITDYVFLGLSVGDHTEQLKFAVADLGTHDDHFIGQEWLKLHIDWKTSEIRLDRGPNECKYTRDLRNPKADEEEKSTELKPGDRLYALDLDAYLWKTNIVTELAVKAAEGKKERMLEEMLPPHYLEYWEVFKKKDFDTLPERRPWDHVIKMTPDCKVYPLTGDEQKALEEFLDENLCTKRIRPSKSPMASPFFFVKKKDGKLQPVQNYRKLNEMTIKNWYPLPLIKELVDHLKGSKIFTKLDVRWGYNNIRIKEGDEWKVAFRMNRRLFEPTVMFFGLTNSPATFQSIMDHIFWDLINTRKVSVYIDNIVIHTQTLEEHWQITKEVLEILWTNKLYIKPEKCEIKKEKIEYLGVVVSEGQIKMDPIKTEALTSWLTPRKLKELQSFLGFCNFYRRFINDYSKIAKPLNQLTGKEEWKWGPEQETAFKALRKAITEWPVDNKPYWVEADSSNFAIGAVLSQRQNKKWHPIAYLSKSLTEAERNYKIYNKELLAIMTALAEWQHYLLTGKEFEIWTDHHNLCYFWKAQKLNHRQAWWVTELGEYKFTMHHKPGKTNIKADILSRWVDHNRGEDNNKDMTVLKDKWFRRIEIFQRKELEEEMRKEAEWHLERIIPKLKGEKKWEAVEALAMTLQEEWMRSVEVEAKTEEEIIIQWIKKLTRNEQRIDWVVEKALRNKEREWEREKGLITWKNRIHVPKDQTLWGDIIRDHHDRRTAGHPGWYKTQELITRNYWWPYIQSNVHRYIEGCQPCQQAKTRKWKIHTPLQPNSIPEQPWEHITVDFITRLPILRGYDVIMVVVDRFTKYVIAIPTTGEISSIGTAKLSATMCGNSSESPGRWSVIEDLSSPPSSWKTFIN